MSAVDRQQQIAARVAGGWYLLAMAAGVFAEAYARGQVVVRGDAARTAANIVASPELFRLGTLTHLLVFAGDALLVVMLYTVLERVGRPAALLAAFWRLIGCAVLATILLGDFAMSRILTSPGAIAAFDRKQLHALSQLFLSLEGTGFQIGFVFLGLGSVLFSALWFRSRYVPRLLAGWGIFASLLLAFGTLAVMAVPSLSRAGMAYMFPMGLYEVGLGGLLLVRGIRAPESPSQSTNEVI